MHCRLYNCHYNIGEKIAFLLTQFSPKFLLHLFVFFFQNLFSLQKGLDMIEKKSFYPRIQKFHYNIVEKFAVFYTSHSIITIVFIIK